MHPVQWVKNNKLAAFLLAVIGFYLFRNFFFGGLGFDSVSRSGFGGINQMESFGAAAPLSMKAAPSYGGVAEDAMSLPVYEAPPEAGVTNRMVVQDSDLSLLVKNVVQSRNKVIKIAADNGGYMVSANTSNPQDAPTANVVIRVDSAKLETVLEALRGLSVKVVSENLTGYDVTDEYVDIDKRIATYEKTKAQFEKILDSAVEISDITNLTHQIIGMQNQIDSLRGQQEGMKKRAALAKVTVYLSTDEMALPYAPSETFRPEVIFKQAVRSMVGMLRKLATVAIWLGVYAVIWLPILAVIYLIRRWKSKPPVRKVN